jgi:hypothetical protein
LLKKRESAALLKNPASIPEECGTACCTFRPRWTGGNVQVIERDARVAQAARYCGFSRERRKALCAISLLDLDRKVLMFCAT